MGDGKRGIVNILALWWWTSVFLVVRWVGVAGEVWWVGLIAWWGVLLWKLWRKMIPEAWAVSLTLHMFHPWSVFVPFGLMDSGEMDVSGWVMGGFVMMLEYALLWSLWRRSYRRKMSVVWMEIVVAYLMAMYWEVDLYWGLRWVGQMVTFWVLGVSFSEYIEQKKVGVYLLWAVFLVSVVDSSLGLMQKLWGGL